MEHIACDTCGSDKPLARHDLSQSLSLEPSMSVVQCAKCGLRYMNPRMTAAEYRDFYSGTTYLQDYGYQDLLSSSRVPEFRRTLGRIRQRLAPPGDLLDIGTATGEFLVEARRDGWTVFGTEVSDSSIKKAKENFQLDLFHGELADAPFPEHSFSVIHLSHVLEHVPSPQQTLRDIKRFLKKDGLLVIEVPNEFENWFVRLGKKLGRYKAPKQPSVHHVYFFTQASLAASLQQAGFQADVSTYSPQLPLANPPSWSKPIIRWITSIVDRLGGGIHIQAICHLPKE